jgi:hypothetical protein
MMPRKVVLYEVNEVPWTIIDLFVAARPRSNLAAMLDESLQLTTLDDDPVDLLPWRSWPTLHRSRYTSDHNAYDQGQDPETFRGTPLWDVVDSAELPVGLFGVLQSWPARRFRAGGFYVPDSFGRTPNAEPPSLQRFQQFNTAMTRENGFAPTRNLSPGELAGVGVDLLTKGLSAWSATKLAGHLVRERFERRYMAARPIMQVLPCFDLYWRLHRQTEPALSIFFTNHVASMMHRFWGDWVPGYAAAEPYRPDPVYREFILRAMELFDHQLGRVRRWIDRHPEYVLLVATALGQGPIPYEDMSETYVLERPEQLISELGIEGAEPTIAMYPRITLSFANRENLEDAHAAVQSVRVGDQPLFRDFRVLGETLSFEIAYQYDATELVREARWDERHADIGSLGVDVRSRPGGGNTAQHTRDGVLFAYGAGLEADPSRDKISILDVAPSTLALLGLDPSPDMYGASTAFDGRIAP